MGSLGWTSDGVGSRRRSYGAGLAAALVPAVTFVLSRVRHDVALTNDLLVYLLSVLVVTCVGGLWPALAAAVASVLCLNYYFTPPIHTWTIESGQNIAALLLFVTLAATFAAVVHLAAREAAARGRSAAEASALADLAQTVLEDDSPDTLLAHLARTHGVAAVLEERGPDGWKRVAGAQRIFDDDEPWICVRPRAGLQMRAMRGHEVGERLFRGVAAQAAAALDRSRLREQAARAEALTRTDEMRTALLVGVSHDLRTPLAAVKAGVSSLRQTDVEWSPGDRDELLMTVEDGTDRLEHIVDNLLDMSRLQTGSLTSEARPTAVDEVLPTAIETSARHRVQVEVPDDLPLVLTDPGLLERVIANLISNALAFSGEAPVEVRGAVADSRVAISVVDHGPGVADADRELMFQPFHQLGDRHGGGLGLGLAVATGFVRAIGAELDVSTTEGGGLTMTVLLPVAPRDAR